MRADTLSQLQHIAEVTSTENSPPLAAHIRSSTHNTPPPQSRNTPKKKSLTFISAVTLSVCVMKLVDFFAHLNSRYKLTVG